MKALILSMAMVAVTMAFRAPVGADSFEPGTGTIVDARWKSGLPLGGVGVGKIELLTDGSFGNLTNQHNWDRPYGWAKGAFAAIQVQGANGTSTARLLRLGSANEYTGVENIAHTRMQGWFPRAEIAFADAALPVQVKLDAFSPLVPHNPKDSSLPVARFDYTLTNPSRQRVKASVLLAWPNLLGWGGKTNVKWDDVSGASQSAANAGGLHGLRYATTQSYTDQRQNVLGEDFLGARQELGITITTCPSWDAAATTPSFWKNFAATGQLHPAADGAPAQSAGAVAATVDLAPGQSRTVHFTLAWAMPHMVTVQQREQSDLVLQSQVPPTAPIAQRWTTSHFMVPGDTVTVDLGRATKPDSLTFDQGGTPEDYPRGLRVEVSSDGKNWQQVAQKTEDGIRTSIQNGKFTVALSPVAGRFVRLTNLGSSVDKWWSIHALQAHDADGNQTLSFVPVGTPQAVEDTGHYWQNFWKGAPEIASYADQNSERLLRETRAWQDPVRASSLPFWLKLKLVNCTFPLFSNTVLTRNGRFAVLESPIDMGGALGTMDQRMASHAFYTAFFPELDRAELEMFADCQQKDGRITHFDGNVHEVVGRPDVGYGITDWPDLSCSWVMQAAKLYRWTGDEAYLQRIQPHIGRAMTWLDSNAQTDGFIPAGGSTYDYEQLPRGAFIYSASCYLGALRSAAAVGTPDQAKVYDARLLQTQNAVMSQLWNGTYFRKWKQLETDKTVDDSFVANMAGDWLARLSGMPRTLAPNIIHQSIAQTIARHQKPFFPVPPMQVTSEGRATTSSCYFLQHEPFLGCEAIYENYVDDGLETLRRVYLSSWELNHSPWDQSLAYDAPAGPQGGLVTYMTCPTSWFVLNALGGTSLDVPHRVLYVSPRLATSERELHIPVFFPRFWGTLDYIPATRRLTLRVDRVFEVDGKIQSSLYHTVGASGDAVSGVSIAAIAADGDAPLIRLPRPFAVKAGATLDLSPFIGQLAIPAKSEVVNFEVRAHIERPGLAADTWKLTDTIRPTPELSASFGNIALDGNAKTRWTTGRPMVPGDQITLDMASSQRVARLVLDSSDSPQDYPRGYVLEASNDGKAWRELARATAIEAETATKDGVLSITFPPTDTRFLRLTNQGTANGLFWSIHELSVYPPMP
ncbi:hypothetical protein IAD21_02399 [Abditibacteriota bacterium]|nr:hypothetical protein IAD21_02399 [Abditibacteriota bacterium]